MKLRMDVLIPVVAGCFFLATAQVRAEQLADIKAKGTLLCGVLDIFEPFGYTDTGSRAVIGYDVDVCNAVAKRLGVKADIKPVSIEARIPQLQQGHMDLLAAGLAYSAQRAGQIDYSDAYYVSQNIVAARTSRGFTSIGDLAGKRISFVKGSISESYIKEQIPTATAIGFEDVSTAFTALMQGKVEGFSTSEETFQKLASRLGANASSYATVQPAIGREVWGLGVRKGQKTMLQAVNGALRDMEASGESQAIFDKWLGTGTLYKMHRSFKVEPIE